VADKFKLVFYVLDFETKTEVIPKQQLVLEFEAEAMAKLPDDSRRARWIAEITEAAGILVGKKLKMDLAPLIENKVSA
jgi:hypothetical protein